VPAAQGTLSLMTTSESLADRLYHDAAAALELYTVYLGERLGYYRALADGGPATPAELATRTGTVERYAREWLEQQAANGLITVDDPTAEENARRYTLPAEHVGVLVDRDDLNYAASRSIELARVARQLPELVEVYRTGGAPSPQPWEPEGRAEPNRPEFVNLLGQQWLPAVTDVDERLRADPPARVADLACGTGWSSIAMALAYPKITVLGLDLDARALEAASANATSRGVADRVTFEAIDAGDITGTFDLVTIIEALHDMTRPVEVLQTAKGLLAEGGTLIVADVKVGDEFTAPAPLRDRYEYGWSVLACLPSAMGDPDSAATGTVLRSGTLRRYAKEAGFTDVEILPITTEFWRFYRLIP
jgi:ubiquinone/menaquinone biosynthesis C-methylase UbiE